MLNKKNKYKKPKKYAVIIKVDTNKFCKYRVNNIDKFIVFLNSKFPLWRYLNIYDRETKAYIKSEKNPNKTIKKYTVIVCVDDNKKCCKWKVDDYKNSLVSWLNVQHPNWKWINVYDTISRAQVDNIKRSSIKKD